MEIPKGERVDSLALRFSKPECQAGRQNPYSVDPASRGLEEPRRPASFDKANGMVFRGLQKISLLDYPGKIAAILFVGGCNLRCPYCYNRDLVMNFGSPSVSEGEILDYLEARREWIDGVVVTGGEPTIHAGLPSFLEKVKNLGFSAKLDTNGSNSKMLAELLEKNLLDYIALDVKAPLLPERYPEASGTQSDGVLEEVENSIALLKGSNGVDYELRTTVVPKLLNKDDVVLIAERIRGAKRYYLQQFVPTGSHVDENYSSVEPYSFELLKEIQREIAHNFGVCKVRGATTNFRINSHVQGSTGLSITFSDLSPKIAKIKN